MARPRKTDAPDTTQAHELTAGLIERFKCPAGKQQAFLRDSKAPGLRVRITAAGAKSFVFEGKLHRQTIRRTIGDVRAWTIEQARTEANRLRVTLDDGDDPRELERQEIAAKAALAAEIAAKAEAERRKAADDAITVGEVWQTYIDERRPFWGELHYRDHINKALPGGVPSGRRGSKNQVTKPGPLAPLMAIPLRQLNQETIEAWAASEGKARPASARLAWRLLTVFLNWCSEHKDYAHLVPAKNPAKSKKSREALGKAGTKSDALMREQLPAWFAQVRQLSNPIVSAYLQTLLLTGARPGEVVAMRWEDVNMQWKGISIHDKVEGSREIPLTPYVRSLIVNLPRRNEWVFPSARRLNMDEHNIERRAKKAAKRGEAAPLGEILNTSATGHIVEPNTPHTRACIAAGLQGLTLHGLRRSFKSLSEWLDLPAGVVAQIMGHKPSATAEKHYTVRPLDLLRLHHEKLEAWILEQAGIEFDAEAEPGKLQLVVS